MPARVLVRRAARPAAIPWAPLTAVLRTRCLPAVFTLLFLGAVAPVLSVRVPPLADYVNHLARMHIIASVDADPLLARFYEIRWAIIPNLVMDLVVPAFTRVLDVYGAGQAFIVLTVAGLVTGPMAIHRAAFGRFSPVPLLAFPFVFNGVFLYGFMNYLLGLGVALWGVAAWLALRDRPAAVRLAVATAVVLALFACHLFAVGLYGLAVLSVEAWRLAALRPPRPAAVARAALAVGLPFLPVVPLMLASPTLGLSGEVVWEAHGKIEGLFLIVRAYHDAVDLTVAGLLAAAAVWAARRNLLCLHPMGWVLLAFGAAVFMAMPRMLFGSWMADQRLPVALLFLLIGFVRVRLAGRTVRGAFYAVVVGVTLVRCADVQANWQRIGQVAEDMRAAIALMEPGGTLLIAHADQPAGSEALNQALSHAACIAIIERSALVSTAFSVPGKQVLSIRPDYRDRVDTEDGDPPTVSQLLAAAEGTVADNPRHWDAWPERYGYVAILYTETGDANPDPDRLALVHEGPHFQLYRVVPPS